MAAHRYVSLKFLDQVRRQSQSTRVARNVLYALVFFLNEKTKDCYPSIDTLCRESGWERDAVMDAISELEELGEIHVDRSRRNNTYTLTLGGDSSEAELAAMAHSPRP